MIMNWKVSKADRALITDIASRAAAIAKQHGADHKATDFMMDLTACHANGCRLDLRGLSSAAPFDFSHDVFGIARHLNRTTGQLQDCFVPRFAER